MAKTQKDSVSTGLETPSAADKAEKTATCGIIMPISATANQTEQHWLDVQRLLHRGIEKAGFLPINVWLNETTDRVSERIIGNIFSHDLVVADISDLNPNVMLELGLRLASKKPTIVVVNANGTIPFDIRDFHALQYPADLNIFGMEAFFEKLEDALRSKHAAYGQKTYIPFLGGVVVEVLAPETRPVAAEALLLSRVDELLVRFQRVEKIVGQEKTPAPARYSRKSKLSLLATLVGPDHQQKVRLLESAVDAEPQLISAVVTRNDDSQSKLAIEVYGGLGVYDVIPVINNIAAKLGIAPDELTLSPFP